MNLKIDNEHDWVFLRTDICEPLLIVHVLIPGVPNQVQPAALPESV